MPAAHNIIRRFQSDQRLPVDLVTFGLDVGRVDDKDDAQMMHNWTQSDGHNAAYRDYKDIKRWYRDTSLLPVAIVGVDAINTWGVAFDVDDKPQYVYGMGTQLLQRLILQQIRMSTPARVSEASRRISPSAPCGARCRPHTVRVPCPGRWTLRTGRTGTPRASISRPTYNPHCAASANNSGPSSLPTPNWDR